MNILAIIPARSGSKSIKDKNIRVIAGKPMIAYSIEHAIESKYINRVIVSTDCEKYAEIARKYKAETPFIRPNEYSTDTALDIDVFQHAIKFLMEKDQYIPDIVVHLRPTYPIRDVQDIDNMIEILLQDTQIDSVRSISAAKEIPYKMWLKESDGKITPLIRDIPECYNMPRQQLPTVYYQNACIDVIRTSVVMEKNTMTGKNIHGYVMKENFDIDTEEELLRVSAILRAKQGVCTFCFDIDGVIAQFKEDLDYAKAEPNLKIIKIVNQLYDYGNKIILFTARGYVTKIDWSKVTKEQMKDWGVKYTELKFGKPAADFYIDDRTMTLKEVFSFFYNDNSIL